MSRSRDTHPDAEAVQIALLRNASVARRAGLMRSLSETAIRLSRRAVRRANPDVDEQEALLIWVELHYGVELAAGVREKLHRRADPS